MLHRRKMLSPKHSLQSPGRAMCIIERDEPKICEKSANLFNRDSHNYWETGTAALSMSICLPEFKLKIKQEEAGTS